MLEKPRKMRAGIVLILLFWSVSLFAFKPGETGEQRPGNVFENLTSFEPDQGSIRIRQSGRMEELILTHVEMNERADGVEGYRVQLFSGGGNKAREEALDVKEKVLSKWPDEDVYVKYSAPFWRVRVGSFRHKHGALPLMKKFKEEFPACYIVRVHNIALVTFEE